MRNVSESNAKLQCARLADYGHGVRCLTVHTRHFYSIIYYRGSQRGSGDPLETIITFMGDYFNLRDKWRWMTLFLNIIMRYLNIIITLL